MRWIRYAVIIAAFALCAAIWFSIIRGMVDESNAERDQIECEARAVYEGECPD